MAIVGNFPGGVAVHARGHRCRHFLRQRVAGGDGSMAGLALDPGFEVIGVVEENELRHAVDANPGDSLAFFFEICQLPDGRAVRLDCAVTQHAARRLRQARALLGFSGGVTVFALRARGRVQFVAKRNRLRLHGFGQILFFALVGWRALSTYGNCRKNEEEESSGAQQPPA